MYAELAVDDGVAVVTMRAEGRANAFRAEDVQALDDAVHRALGDADARAVVVTGAGGAFCAGADVAAMVEARDRTQLLRELTKHHHEVVRSLRTSPKPVVAAIDGAAAGGGFGLALAGDLRLGSPRAVFKPGFLSLGLSPDGGLTFTLPRIAGFAEAQRIVLGDVRVDAREAERLGILHRVVEGDVVAEAVAEAKRMAALPREAFAATKGLLNATFDNPLTVQLAEERMLVVKAAGGPEFEAGLARFAARKRA